MILLFILSTILLLTTLYTYNTIRKEYGHIMVPRYLYIIMILSFLLSILSLIIN